MIGLHWPTIPLTWRLMALLLPHVLHALEPTAKVAAGVSWEIYYCGVKILEVKRYCGSLAALH